ncbi:MurR/RpiR family transcriptional regulator [Vallitalea okinawensis]|uniref:MurR/RpiR family transcriptional regulator n=1 Tax=Vallitalea okinawensis TaxID=2078660 RepID=UPI000CFBDB46|nr:MurR/RpiR family transcriptional regulator [Vallitalea okinawensis]
MGGSFFQRYEQYGRQLTKKQKQLAEYVAKNYKTAVFLSSIELGKKVGTSEATVIRLANALGYSGYLEMVKEIREYVKEEITTIDKLERFGMRLNDESTKSIVMANNIKIIKSVSSVLPDEIINKVISDIESHNKIIITGFESSAGMAEYFGYNLTRIIPNVNIVTHNHGNILNVVKNCDEDSFVIALSFPRYSKHVVQLTKMFKENGSKVFGITDSILSPIRPFSDYNVIIPVHEEYTFNLDVSVGVMTILQTIIMEYAATHHEQVEENLNVLEKYNDEYGLFYKS